jgi:hypothetical protein
VGRTDVANTTTGQVSLNSVAELSSYGNQRSRCIRLAHPYVNKPAAMDAAGLEQTAYFVAEPEVGSAHCSDSI